jgi:hypothetical protein
MFKLEDKVGWSSQSHGSRKVKEGLVVQVVPSCQLPDREAFPSLYKGSGIGGIRNHISYVVQVGNKFYWPRVSALRFIGDERSADEAAWAKAADDFSSMILERLGKQPDWWASDAKLDTNFTLITKEAFLAGRRSK